MIPKSRQVESTAHTLQPSCYQYTLPAANEKQLRSAAQLPNSPTSGPRLKSHGSFPALYSTARSNSSGIPSSAHKPDRSSFLPGKPPDASTFAFLSEMCVSAHSAPFPMNEPSATRRGETPGALPEPGDAFPLSGLRAGREAAGGVRAPPPAERRARVQRPNPAGT